MVTGARRSKSKAASVIDSNRPRWRVRHRSTPGSQPVPFRTMDRSLSHVNTSHEGVAFTLRRPSESRPYRHLWAVSTGVEVSTFTPLLGRSPTEASQCRLLVPGRRRFGQKASRSTASAWRHRLHSKASPTLRTVAVESDPGTTVPERSVAMRTAQSPPMTLRPRSVALCRSGVSGGPSVRPPSSRESDFSSCSTSSPMRRVVDIAERVERADRRANLWAPPGRQGWGMPNR
jgi:hypothetical protein